MEPPTRILTVRRLGELDRRRRQGCREPLPRTSHRGPLLIHAGLKIDREAARRFDLELWELPTGVILGQVELVDVVRDSCSEWALPGHFHWLLAGPRPVPHVPAKGQLGLWTL